MVKNPHKHGMLWFFEKNNFSEGQGKLFGSNQMIKNNKKHCLLWFFDDKNYDQDQNSKERHGG